MPGTKRWRKNLVAVITQDRVIDIDARAGGQEGTRPTKNEKMNVFGQKIDAIWFKKNRMNFIFT